MPTPPSPCSISISARIRCAPARASRTATGSCARREREYNYEFGGDYEFGLGGGRLKLIGVRRFEHSPYRQTLTIDYSDGRPREGQRFTQTADETETILRGEYRWRGGVNEWQVSLEGALNRLDVVNNLFALDAGAARSCRSPAQLTESVVEERRAEAILTYGRPLSPTVTLQAAIGGEYSELVQSGAGGLSRQFIRPKGFVNLAWRPNPEPRRQRPDRARRRPAQLLRFRRLVQRQRRHLQFRQRQPRPAAALERRRSRCGAISAPWGTVTGRLYGSLITDQSSTSSRSARPASRRAISTAPPTLYGLQVISTINFDPIGWRGAKLDANLQFQRTSLEDPLTGLRRPFNETMTAPAQHDAAPRHAQHATGLGASPPIDIASRPASGSTSASASSTRRAASAPSSSIRTCSG